MPNTVYVYPYNNRLKLSIFSSFEKEHRYLLQDILKRINVSFKDIRYNDLLYFALDNSKIDNKTAEILKRYND
jgi:hypothetical protein